MTIIQKGLIQRITSSGGGGSAFNSITSGTNTTAAMVVGTGSSLAASGSGTITATAVPASGLSGTTLASGVTGSSLTSVGTLTGLAIAGTEAITSSSATAFAVGRQGATTPVLNIDASTASSVGGISIVGAATGGTTSITATDSGSNHSLSINGKGSGNVSINSITGSAKLQSNSADRISVTSASHTYSVGNRTSVSSPFYSWSGATGATLTASTEAPFATFSMDTATQTHAAGTLSLQRDFLIKNSTHAFSTSSTMTIGATLGIVGAPIASTNATITTGCTIYSAGAAVGAGTTNSYAINLTANTGATNNYITSYNGSAGEVYRLRTDGQVAYLATNTAAGTTGAQTINKPSGTVNFAAAATSLVVTNSLCTTSSIVFAVVRTNDSTATIKNVVPGSGSFTINLGAAATAETSVGFFIIN